MPQPPIVDSHVHLWDTSSFHLDWVHDTPLLNRSYSLEDYKKQTIDLPIEGIVCVEVNVRPEEALREAEWLVEQAHHDARIQGIVAFAPLDTFVQLVPYLEALVALGPTIKGVRRNIQGEKRPGFCLQPDFVRGVQVLAQYNLSFDLCLTHEQLPDGIELARQCPNTRILLDHLAKPDIRTQVLEPWREHLRQLAAFDNVACKISGMVTEADHEKWKEDELVPYLMYALDVFGENRVLFGSDWPVMLLASSYRRWVETLTHLTEQMSMSAQRKLWAKNARDWYHLDTT